MQLFGSEITIFILQRLFLESILSPWYTSHITALRVCTKVRLRFYIYSSSAGVAGPQYEASTIRIFEWICLRQTKHDPAEGNRERQAFRLPHSIR